MHTTGTPPKTPAGLQQRSQEELQLKHTWSEAWAGR